MARPAHQPPAPPDPRRPRPEPGMVQPRHELPDAFEQNPLSEVADRVSLRAADGLDDAARVREALRIVISDGTSINDAARRCHVTPSSLAQWRRNYLRLISEDQSIAARPLLENGDIPRNADLITIPAAAREQFAENWERLLRITRATPSTFHQDPVRLFLENSWMTSWLFAEGRLDRAVLAGAAVALAVMVLTATFLIAGRFYRRDDKPVAAPLNYDEAIRAAAGIALQFFAAPDVEQKSRFVRLNDDIRPGFETYFKNHPASAITFTDARLTNAIPGDNLILLEFECPSLHRTHQCIVIQRDGHQLLDWETSSWFQEANLEDLRRTLSRSPVRIAVRVVEDPYYNFGFQPQSYTCFRLSYPGLPINLYGYARKDSSDAATLLGLLRPITSSERPVTAILSVQYPPGKNPENNQVEILSILNEDWVAK